MMREMKRKIENTRMKSGQVSIEYLIIVGFVTFVVIGILGIALFYSGTIQDRIVITQVENFANKLVSSAESVFYAGEPSKATITVYLPEGVKSIVIDEDEDSIIIEVQTSSGVNKILFSSNVPISGTIDNNYGLKKIMVEAVGDEVVINQGV